MKNDQYIATINDNHDPLAHASTLAVERSSSVRSAKGVSFVMLERVGV